MEHASIKNQNFSVCLQDTLLIKKEMPNHKSPSYFRFTRCGQCDKYLVWCCHPLCIQFICKVGGNTTNKYYQDPLNTHNIIILN